MNKLTKTLTICLLILLLAVSMALVACNQDPPEETDKVTVTFDTGVDGFSIARSVISGNLDFNITNF